MPDTRYGICTLCEAACGVAVDVEEGRIVKLRGDEEDAFSGGYICPKAVGLIDVQRDPDRVVRPLRRDGARWIEAEWDEAFDAVSAGIARVQRRHGRDAVAFYYGNPTGHSYSGLLFAAIFTENLRTKNRYSSNSVDSLPRLLASSLLYGSLATIPIPDLDRTDFLLVLGANPAVSNGSAMMAPGAAKRLTRLRERGGRLVVIDPRRTETAELADTHHFIRPGTDALLLAAMLRTLFEEGLSAPGRLEPMIAGLPALRAAVGSFAPELVAAATGIGAGAIRALARDFSRARAGVAYGRMGTCVQEFGAVTTWLVDALNIVTGNLDRPGGAMFSTPAVDLGRLARALGQTGLFRRWTSRDGRYPEFNGELPVAAFADEMETPGPRQIRALVTHAGNPALSLPNGRRLDRAFEKLEFMVSIDLYRNETTRHASWILPPSFGLEHDQYPLLGQALGVRNTAHYAPAQLPRPAGVKHDWEIFVELVKRMGPLGRAQHAALSRLGSRGILRLLLRLGGRARLDELEAAPHGVDLGPLEPRLPALLHTRSRRLELAPAPLLRDLDRLRAKLAELRTEASPGGELRLIGRRTLRSNNSWMHNSLRLVKGRPRCTLLMHPDDAAARGIVAGGAARIRSAVGEIEAPVEVSSEIMPGVVSLPHGWGHDWPGAQLSVARAHAGVSVNDVTHDQRVDALSGASNLSGVPVTVTAAAGAAGGA